MAQTTSEVWDSRWSSTRRTVRPDVIDNFFEEYGTLDLHRKSGLQVTDDGGKEIQVILESSGATAESFSGLDELSKSKADPFESAFYKRRYYAAPVVISDTDNWENSGAAQIFNLLEALGNNAMQSLMKAINEDLHTAQTGKNIIGYPDIMATSTGATVGGISSSSSTFWESQRDTSSTTFLTQTVTNIFDGIEKWSDIRDACRVQGASKMALVTTPSIVRAYRTALASQGYGETRLGNVQGIGGAINPSFYGSQVVEDNDCTALSTYVVDLNAVKLNVLKSANFKKTAFTSLQSNGQLGQIAYVVAGVQLTTNNRRRSGRATALTGA